MKKILGLRLAVDKMYFGLLLTFIWFLRSSKIADRGYGYASLTKAEMT